MLFRGGVDALLMRTQLAVPEVHFLQPDHYNAIFTTHGVIMILFMAMPLMFGLFNIVVPLQIGARDVAYPFLNCTQLLAVLLRRDAVQHVASSSAVRRMRAGWLIRRSRSCRTARASGRTSISGAFRFQGSVA